jgi:amino acid transporter
MTAPSNIQRLAAITSTLSASGACLWFVLASVLYFTSWPPLGGILVGLTTLQVVFSIASGAVLRRLRRWPDTPQRMFALAFGFGVLPVVIVACVVVTGWVLLLSGS